MSIYGHVLESTNIINNEDNIKKILKTIASQIENAYNKNAQKLGLHTVKGDFEIYNDINDNDEKVKTIKYCFSDYNDPEDDWKHSYEYYNSGNSDLSEDKLNIFLNNYDKMIEDIESKVNKFVSEYKNKGYNINYEYDDYRGTQINIYCSLPLDNSSNKDLIKDIVSIVNENISKMKVVKSNINGSKEYATVGKGKKEKYIIVKRYNWSIDRKYTTNNGELFMKTIKQFILSINELYTKNKDEFDKSFLSYSLDVYNYYKDYVEIILKAYYDESLYNPKLYKSIILPEFAYIISLGNKMKIKAEPIKNQLFSLIDKKIKEEFNIVSNLNNCIDEISNSVLKSKNIISTDYNFKEKVYPQDQKMPILDYIRKEKQTDGITKLKNIVNNSIQEITSKNSSIYINQSWMFAGNFNHTLKFIISIGFKY